MSDKPFYHRQSKYPSVIQMGKNLIYTAGKVGASVISGKRPTVPKEKADSRLAICKKCPHFVAKDQRCTICGCAMRMKTYLYAAHCPLSPPKW